jgi:hypothetical protein
MPIAAMGAYIARLVIAQQNAILRSGYNNIRQFAQN